MKNTKSAFTLAELLLCLAIIGIVSAMGMVITKHSAERAYNLFFYNGYINLYNSIADIINTGETINISDLNDRLGTTKDVPADNIIKTVNGITYAINGNDIIMTVPQQKTRNNNGRATVRFRYVEMDNGYLIPLTAGSSVNLQDRRDLLPAYIDDGVVGRMKRTSFNGNTYRMSNIRYYTYREALCNVRNGNSITDSGATILSCIGVAIPAARPVGVLKIADPRKAR